MYTDYTLNSIQQRFCEGFLLFPFKQLKKSGHYIYKQYRSNSGIKQVLDERTTAFDFHCFFAKQLSDKITKTAIPNGIALMRQVEHLFEGAGKDEQVVAAIYTEFTEMLTTYYSELSNYQSVVLLRQQSALKPMLKRSPDCSHAHEVYNSEWSRMIKQFIANGNEVVKFLRENLEAYGYQRLPVNCTREDVEEVIVSIQSYNTIQYQLISLLQQWHQRQQQHNRQVYLN
ncbi:hypothetical protein [Chitinophaga sp. Cy-1792]|uniref:hypothetical protein n=1 Tax=Chitinophaga sp. Cy-1792 TaxID=2608339 RepID=UPI001422CBF3|nr:hypothetical protein [Chitinophaga sp. Cy-1792]NIG57443.1 hypothetical protein [Chitinophaga sp. Cy-1792]